MQDLHALVGPEALEQVLRPADGDHLCAFLPSLFQLGNRAGHNAGESTQPVALGEQPTMVAPQCLHLVHPRGQDPSDLRQPHPELPQHENLLQPQQLALLVIAVTVAPDPRRRQQTDLVVVPQRPSRHPRHPSNLRDRPGHRRPLTRPTPSRNFGSVQDDRSFRSGSFKPSPATS